MQSHPKSVMPTSERLKPSETQGNPTKGARVVVQLTQGTQRMLVGAELCKAHALAGGLSCFVQPLWIPQDLDLPRPCFAQLLDVLRKPRHWV